MFAKVLTIASTFPMHSKVKSQPPPNLSWRYWAIGWPSLVGLMTSVQPNFFADERKNTIFKRSLHLRPTFHTFFSFPS